MRAAPTGDDLGDDFGAGGADDALAAEPAGGYAARRAKRRRLHAAGPSGARRRRPTHVKCDIADGRAIGFASLAGSFHAKG